MGAQNGIAHFVGRSGMTYTVNIYLDDTGGNPIRVSQAGKAGSASPTDWTPPEPVALVDIVIAAAPTVTNLQLTRNGQPTGDVPLIAAYLASVYQRPPLRVVYSPIARFGAFELS